jgi:HSP20 family protein
MRWHQLRDLIALQDRLDPDVSAWAPAVDLYETADQFVLLVELSGVAPDDAQIDARADRLTLRGARRPESDPPPRFLQLERGHGPFERSFAFAHEITVDGITAEFHDGVLTITVPKRQPTGARRVPIG